MQKNANNSNQKPNDPNQKSNNISNWKHSIEKSFGNLGRLIAKRPFIFLLTYLLIIGVLASNLINIKQDTSIEGLLQKGSQEIKTYDEFKALFGRDELIFIGIDVEDIFEQKFIDQLRALHEQLEAEVPHLKRVDSLINARHTYGEDDTLYIDDLLPAELPTELESLAALKEYTYSNPNIKNLLLSEEKNFTAITLQMNANRYETDNNGKLQAFYLDDDDLQNIYNVVNTIIDQHKAISSSTITIAGTIPIGVLLSNNLEKDFILFTVLAIILIALLLSVIFRRASGVFMPIIVMILGVVSTISFMAIMKTPIQVSTSILPSFLLAVCVGDSIHLLTIFYRHYDSGNSKVESLAYAMQHTGLAIFFTSITTAVGLASFAFSELTPVSSLGFYGALGSIIAFILTVFILPCLLCLMPLKQKKIKEDNPNILQSLLNWCASFSIKHAKIVVISCGFLFLVSAYTASGIRFSHLPVAWLANDEPAVLSQNKHEEKMGGSISIEVLLDTGKDRGISNPEFLKVIDEISKEIETWETDTYHISKTISVIDIIKESNRALHDNNQEHYTIPDSQELISQELFLVELDAPDDLFNMIDASYRKARISIILPWIDAIHLGKIIQRIETYIHPKLEPYTESITLTGSLPILGTIFAEMLYSTAQSYGIAAIFITIMMVLLIGSLKLGLISMIPSLLPIFIVISLFRLFGVPLDILTMLVGSIAIGLTVDDNVHFMHGFRRSYAETGDVEQAIKLTLFSTGRAMLITSIVLSLGFIIYTQSTMTNMQSFGVMTSLCIALALAATFLLSPALMVLSHKKKA